MSQCNCSLSLWGWSEEVNSRIFFLSYMVYLKPKHSLGYQQHLYQVIIIYIRITSIIPTFTRNYYVHTQVHNTCSIIPLLFLPLLIPLLPSFPIPFTYLEPPCCDRICPPWSQVACKLTSPSLFSQLPHHPKFPVPKLFIHLTTTTSRLRLLLSGTVTFNP